MKGMILAFAGALVVGLGGGALGAALRVQQLEAAAAAAKPAVVTDSARSAAGLATGVDSAPSTPTDSSLAPVVAPAAEMVAAPAPAAAPASPGDAALRVGKRVAAMPPRDAARVLAQMADSEIVQVLSAVTERKAAAILTQLPPERAAAVVRAGLKGDE